MQLPANSVIRCKSLAAAARWLAFLPVDCARRVGTNVIILQPVDVAFTMAA